MVPHDVQDAEEQVVCLLLKKIEKKKTSDNSEC